VTDPEAEAKPKHAGKSNLPENREGKTRFSQSDKKASGALRSGWGRDSGCRENFSSFIEF
jgi:hypothetical protein